MTQPVSVTLRPPPQPQRPKKPWTLIWWCVLALAVGLWFAGNFGAGVSWQDGRLPVIPEGQTWSAVGVSLTSNTSVHGTTITIPGEDPVHATSGAVFVAVTVDYTLASADLNQACSMVLVGNGRTWLPGDVALSLTIGDAVPGVNTDCSSTDPDGDPTLSGTTGALFEIPETALGEIQGVQITVQDAFTWADLGNVTPIFTSPSASAVFKITIQ